MKSSRYAICLILVLAVAAADAVAQGFDSGSDGTFGPIDVTIGAPPLDMPPDGIFHATTINVASGATLKFKRNPLNTPVYLLATGDILIEGTIDVSGEPGTTDPPVGGLGGPGGFAGGHPGTDPSPPGAGHGPGAGLGGDTSAGDTGAGGGAYGTAPLSSCLTLLDGSTYGSGLLVPLVGGSGGGGTTGMPGRGGGGGGGAILLASNTRIDINSSGRVDAQGGDVNTGHRNNGSGGAIRIVAPVVAGNGSLRVNAGICGGSAGRLRVDTIDRTALQFSFQPTSTTQIGSLMFVFPSVVPRLDVIEAAGQIIPVDQPDPVLVVLPFGSTTMRTVTVQAHDFTGIVPISVVLTPDSGDRIVVDASIDMGTGNPAQVVVNVDIPVNTQTHVEVWTR